MRGLGTDIVEIVRIEKALGNRRFLARVYTQREQEYLQSVGKLAAQSAAGMFCAKEAVAKALGSGFSGGLRLTDIEITHSALGAPEARVAGRDELRLLLSISHCREYATATALLWEEEI
ncbi:MAG: holo-ACP synthase [Intestinibacillus sp.]